MYDEVHKVEQYIKNEELGGRALSVFTLAERTRTGGLALTLQTKINLLCRLNTVPPKLIVGGSSWLVYSKKSLSRSMVRASCCVSSSCSPSADFLLTDFMVDRSKPNKGLLP